MDEDTQAHRLVKMLKFEGHNILTASEASLAGKPDQAVLGFARSHGRVLLTRNSSDFFLLHEADSAHSGILAIYRDVDLQKGMDYSAIVRAIGNLESTGLLLKGQFIVLNQYNW